MATALAAADPNNTAWQRVSYSKVGEVALLAGNYPVLARTRCARR